MRETENEINLLLTGEGDIFTPPYGAPPWAFQPPRDDGAGMKISEIPEGDEMGMSALGEKGGR